MLVMLLMLLVIIGIIVWMSWPPKTSFPKDNRPKNLTEIFPELETDDILVIGIKTFMIDQVDIFPFKSENEESLNKMGYKMIKIISNRTDLIRMLNYQGFSHKKIRRQLLGYLTDNGDPKQITELKSKITV